MIIIMIIIIMIIIIIITTTTTTTVVVVVVVIIIIIIAFKGANGDFLQSPHCAANRLQHVRSSGTGTIVCKSRATQRSTYLIMCLMSCYVPRGMKAQLSF